MILHLADIIRTTSYAIISVVLTLLSIYWVRLYRSGAKSGVVQEWIKGEIGLAVSLLWLFLSTLAAIIIRNILGIGDVWGWALLANSLGAIGVMVFSVVKWRIVSRD